LVGAALMGLVWLKLGAPPIESPFAKASPPPARSEAARPQDDKTTEASAEEAPEVVPPRFEYASVLPEMEVVIPPEDLRPKRVDEMDRPATVTTPPAGADSAAVYDLQLGSFTKKSDAERMKASLALLGINARIQKVTVDDRGTYYRVRSGPYSRDQAYSLHAQLDNNGVDNQIYRLK